MTFLKFTSLTVLYLFILLGIEALLLMLATGTAFNSIALPVTNNVDFLILLIKNNLWSGIQELIAQPVLILGNSSTTPGDYVVALYYYPINSLLHIAFAVFISSRVIKQPKQLLGFSFILGSLMLLISINYVWLAACCGAAPGWTLDTLLLNYALAVNADAVSRMDFYEAIYSGMYLLQIFLIVIAGLLLWRSTAKKGR